jgi:hypothetical protein
VPRSRDRGRDARSSLQGIDAAALATALGRHGFDDDAFLRPLFHGVPAENTPDERARDADGGPAAHAVRRAQHADPEAGRPAEPATIIASLVER